MCRSENADPATLCREVIRLAVKDHRCDECGRTISAGERYEFVHGLYDGHWDTYHTCQHCQAARAWLERECGGWVYTEVRDELIEHWEEDWIYRTIWLARVIAGMKHRWHDGRLPVPATPPVVAA
jgi:hypothetical protein